MLKGTKSSMKTLTILTNISDQNISNCTACGVCVRVFVSSQNLSHS